MSRIKIFTFLLLILSAVAANAQTSYKSAVGKVKIAGKTIVVKSEAYLNAMPRVVDKNQSNLDCSKTGTLITPVTVETADNSSLPKSVEIKQIWIKNNGYWWRNTSNKDETETKENSISSVARACPASKFKADKPVKVVVQITYKGKSYFISSSQTKVERVF